MFCDPRMMLGSVFIPWGHWSGVIDSDEAVLIGFYRISWPLRFSIVIGYFTLCLDVFNSKQAKMRFTMDCQLFHFAVWGLVAIINQPTQWVIFMGGINAKQRNIFKFSALKPYCCKAQLILYRPLLTTMSYCSIQNQTGKHFASLCTFSAACPVHIVKSTPHGTRPQRIPFQLVHRQIHHVLIHKSLLISVK